MAEATRGQQTQKSLGRLLGRCVGTHALDAGNSRLSFFNTLQACPFRGGRAKASAALRKAQFGGRCMGQGQKK